MAYEIDCDICGYSAEGTNCKQVCIHCYNQLEKDLRKQCKQTKTFGDKLLIFQKKQENIMYEKKLKQYRDEIIQLKKSLAQTKTKEPK